MKENTLKNELTRDGYSKEEQYFYELNLKLRNKISKEQKSIVKKPVATQREETLIRENRIKERAIQRWETDGGLIRNVMKP